MNVEQIKAYCRNQYKAYEERPFGEVPVCYKLNGKIFAQLYPYPEDFKITLKCTDCVQKEGHYGKQSNI